MGIIEGLAARFNLAGDRKFNQNENRVPVGNPEVYAPGISAEDAYKLQLVQQAQDANYAKAVAAMRGASVTNGQIAPEYWNAAQKASDYELGGLAGRQGR